MAAQISQFSKCIQRKMTKSFSEQNGGDARAWHRRLAGRGGRVR
jgi:hypothetical protein